MKIYKWLLAGAFALAVSPLALAAKPAPAVSDQSLVVPTAAQMVSRTLLAHFTDEVNVKDFGADPTGAADSTAAFAAAQAAILASPTGGQLTIPPGTYSLVNAPSFTLSGNQAETIMGGGRRATTLLISGSGFNATLTGTSTGFSVRRMSIVHTGSRGGTAVTATRTVSPSVGGTDDFSELMVSGATPSTSFQNGIVTTGENGATFDDDQIVLPNDASTSMAMGHGVEINGTSSTLFAVDNKFQNDVFDGGTAGIYVGPYVQGIFWSNSEAVGNDYGVYWASVTGSDNPELLKMTGGHINSHVAGVYLQNVNENLISNVLFLNFGPSSSTSYSAILMVQSFDNTITGNVINGAGIGSESFASLTGVVGSVIDANQVTFLAGPALNLLAGTTGNVISGNNMNGVSTPAITNAAVNDVGTNQLNGQQQSGSSFYQGSVVIAPGAGTFLTQDNTGNAGYIGADGAGGLNIASARSGSTGNVSLLTGGLSAIGLRSAAVIRSATGTSVSVPDVQIGSAAGFDQFTGPDSFTIGGTAMPDTPAGWVSPAPAFNPTVNMVTAPYGSFNAGCGLCLFMSQDNITANRAGISGVDYRTGSSAMPAIGSNDAVGFYEQPQNYAAKMVLTAASYTATEVVLKTPLTAEQMSLLRTNMYLVTNSIDPTSPTGTASDGLPVNNLMEGFISGWDPAGTYITVAGWASVSGTGVANAIPSTIALDTAYSTYSSPTVFIGAPTKVWGRNTYINYQTPGSNPTTSLIRRFEGEEMDWRYNASKANEVDFHGLTMSFAPTGGVGPAGMTSDSYALLMNGVLPRYVVIQDSGAVPVLIDTGFYQMGSNGESTTIPNAEMFEHDAYADGANLMRLEGRVIHTGTATGWTGAEMDLGLWIDGGQGNNAGTYAGGLKFNANGTAQASVSLCGQNGCAITAQANGLPKIVNVTYSQLPACAANLEGTVAEVTDANTSTFGAAITAGGGSNHMMGRCNGTAWVVD